MSNKEQRHVSFTPDITNAEVNSVADGVSEMVRMDLKYIREISLRKDFRITLKAICLMFGKKRANETRLKDQFL